MFEHIKMSYSLSDLKNSKMMAVRDINILPANIKLSYREILFFSCFVFITFEQLNEFPGFFF